MGDPMAPSLAMGGVIGAASCSTTAELNAVVARPHRIHAIIIIIIIIIST